MRAEQPMMHGFPRSVAASVLAFACVALAQAAEPLRVVVFYSATCPACRE